MCGEFVAIPQVGGLHHQYRGARASVSGPWTRPLGVQPPMIGMALGWPVLAELVLASVEPDDCLTRSLMESVAWEATKNPAPKPTGIPYSQHVIEESPIRQSLLLDALRRGILSAKAYSGSQAAPGRLNTLSLGFGLFRRTQVARDGQALRVCDATMSR